MKTWMQIVCAVCAMMIAVQPDDVWAQDGDARFTADRRSENLDASGGRRPLTEDEMVELRRRELLQDFDSETSLDHGESIHPRLMHSVIDNTLGVRYEEREAYLRILRLAQEVPLRRLQRFAAEIRSERRETTPSYKQRRNQDFPQFVDLFTHPEFYLGRPVTMRGIMRKLTKFDLGKNSLDLDQAYEGWVYTPDSQGNPAVVIFTSKDDRLPVNGDIQEEVQFTGYYFKMYGYDAEDMTRKAPMIIAGEVEWTPHPYKAVYRPIWIGWYGMAAMAFLIGCYVVWQTQRIEMPPRPRPEVEPDFNHMPPLEHPVTDSLFSHSTTETEDA